MNNMAQTIFVIAMILIISAANAQEPVGPSYPAGTVEVKNDAWNAWVCAFYLKGACGTVLVPPHPVEDSIPAKTE